MSSFTASSVLSAALALFPAFAQAQSTPDIIVLGDSQISFGAGQVYLEFFNNLEANCGADVLGREAAQSLGTAETMALGVRSTSLNAWVSRSGKAKDFICEVDKKYGVNAGVYGLSGNNKRKFVQVGKEKGLEYCAPNTSPFEALMARGKPKLLVLAFLGNDAQRWASQPDLAAQDVERTLEQLPSDLPCIFLTTAPVFSKKTNDLRARAQTGIVKAFEKAGGHCQVVEGLTPEVRQAIEGQSRYFRRNDAGRVIDPLHPSQRAIRQFVELNRSKLCRAVSSAKKAAKG